MTQSLPNKNKDISSSNSEVPVDKDFRNLSTSEMEELMNQGVREAKRQVHDLGINTVTYANGTIYEENSNGTRNVRRHVEDD